MGKFKVSFTTALFVFSFVICVIVAVVFVDRAPKNDYDSFYENDKSGDSAGADRDNRDKRPADGWDTSSAAPQTARSAPAATAASPDESNYADLPIDPHLAGMAMPVATPATAAATANPMAGRTPEEIARAVMGQAGVDAAAEAAAIPGMAVPTGIATPAVAATPATTAKPATPYYLPMQSNINGNGSVGSSNALGSPAGYRAPMTNSSSPGGMSAIAPAGSNLTNATQGWNPVSRATPSSMIGIQGAPANPQGGMMISSGESQMGADPPPGFDASPTMDQSATPAAGGIQNQLLMAPQPQTGGDQYQLPPAPTLRPPPIQDPEQRRSEADEIKPETPDSLDPDGSSGQALAVSETDTDPAETEEQQPEVLATVQDRTLTEDQAIKLTEVRFALDGKKLDQDDRKAEAEKTADEWTQITAAAELARKQGLELGAPEIERYAAMRPDFDPATWQKTMADHGFSEQEIRAGLNDIALSEKLIEQQFEEEFSSKQIRAAYEKTPSRYNTPRTIRLQEIYKEKPNDEKRADKIAAEMRRLQRQASSGTDFGLLARQASDAPTANKGGNLGWIDPAKEHDEERDKAIADLEAGEVTDVIEEVDGFRIYKLAEVKEATSDFEGGKNLLIADLKKPIRKTCYSESLEKLEADEPTAEAKIKTAVAKAAKNQTENPASDNETADLAEDADDAQDDVASADPEAAARRARAKQVLAEASRRRAAAKTAQNPAATAQVSPSIVAHQPGVQNQLLYAPGTQVQQMAGGQPAPAYQAGGQTAPLQSPVSAPAQISVNYTPSPTGQPLQTQTASPYDNPEYANAARMAAAAAAAAGATPPGNSSQAGPQTTHSNGWAVTKTVTDNNTARSAPQPRQQQASANDPMIASTVPPGFEGSGAAATRSPVGQPAQQQPQQEENSGGLISNVKSFFGGFRK